MHPKHEVRIAVVGKYMKHRDAYKSVYEALDHAGIANRTRVLVVRVEAEEVEGRGAEALLGGVDGILVPGGFGMRGIEGKIEAIRFAQNRRRSRSSAFAWACSAPSSNSPATCSVSRTPTAPSSIRPPTTPSSG